MRPFTVYMIGDRDKIVCNRTIGVYRGRAKLGWPLRAEALETTLVMQELFLHWNVRRGRVAHNIALRYET